MTPGRLGGMAVRALPLVVFFGGWEVLARSGLFTPFLLPTFSNTIRKVFEFAASDQDVAALGLTLYRALAGFAIAAVLGVTLGLLMSRQRAFRWFFDPIVSVGFPLPQVAFMPIFMLWLGLDNGSKITMIAANTIFPIMAMTAQAADGVETHLIWSGRSMGATNRELFYEVVLPAAMPQILTALQVSVPLAFITAIVSEMFMGGEGLGNFMIKASRFAQSPETFAGLIIAGLVGAILMKAMEMLRRRLLVWHAESSADSGG